MPLSEDQQHVLSGSLQIPGLVQSQEEVEQLSFVVDPLTPAPWSDPFSQSDAPNLAQINATPLPIAPTGTEDLPQTGMREAVAMRDLITPQTPRTLSPVTQPGITSTLEHVRPDPKTTASRPPMIIRGSNERNRVHIQRPPQGRRHVIGIAALVLLLVITTGTLLAASPLSHDIGVTLGFQPNRASIFQNTSNRMSLVAMATATAVYHQQTDGFDPTSSSNGPVFTGSSESWPLGVCTYWANLRYHALTGHWVTWTGNAYQWADGARLAGWNVSTSPHVPSIIVLMPGVQGASSYGHVAVVESASGNTVRTSDMNWYVDGGGWDIVSYYNFTAGPGVYFIWA